MPEGDRSEECGPRATMGCCCASLTTMTLSLVVLGSSAGGLQLKGMQGASRSKCTFSSSDAPYEYPNQPLASDDPPYSTLFDQVCIGGGTERAVQGLKTVTDRNDTYICACCGAKLFGGEAKFDSGTGWPSFWAPYDASAVGYARDMMSVELHCTSCGAHLGHVFEWPSGPANPLGLRYCIDGVCLRKVPRAADETGGANRDNPFILHELLVMAVVAALLVSCVGCCSNAWVFYTEARARRRRVRALSKAGARTAAVQEPVRDGL